MKVLITGGNSATALKLAKAFNGDEIVFADYGEMPKFASSQYQLLSLGKKNEEITPHHLLSFCLDNQVEAVLPLRAFEIEPLAKSILLFEEFGIKLLLPKMEVLTDYPTTLSTDNFLVVVGGTVKFNFTAGFVPEIATGMSGAFRVGEKGNLQLITI